MLTKNEAELLQRFAGSDFAEKWEGLRKKFEAGNTITIANTGIYSSGKSTLFNALLGRTEHERFATGAIPTTKKGEREKFAEGVELMDTPGIDANTADDEEAFRMLMEADIILMTHNIRTGMLNEVEYSWLKKIAEGIGREYLSDRLIFVSTWIDGVQDETDRQKLREEIQRQIAEIAQGKSIGFYEVSAKRYYDAVRKSNIGLERASNIPPLKEALQGRAKLYGAILQRIRRSELAELCKASRDSLYKVKYARDTEILSRRKAIDEKRGRAFEAWKGIKSRFESMKSTVSDGLKSIYEHYDSASEYQEFHRRIYDM